MEFTKLGLENFTTKQLFTEIFKRTLLEQHPEMSHELAISMAEDGYDNSDDEIEELYQRIDVFEIEEEN